MKLSHRYIPARQLPDKAVSLLDTACARVAVSQHATPAEVEDCRRRIEGARDRARHHRPRGGGRRRRSASAAPRSPSKLAERARAAGGAGGSAGQDEKAIVDRDRSRCARTLRGGDQPVDRPPAAATAEPGRARALLAELQVEQDKLADAAGRSAADPAERRRAGRGQRGRRLDRHPGRPDGEERARDRSCAWARRSASASSASSTGWT